MVQLFLPFDKTLFENSKECKNHVVELFLKNNSVKKNNPTRISGLLAKNLQHPYLLLVEYPIGKRFPLNFVFF